MKIDRFIAAVCALLLITACACQKKENDAVPRQTVLDALSAYSTISDPVYFEAFQHQGKDPEKAAAFVAARENLDRLFIDDAVQKRILAALRLYDPKAWEPQKTYFEESGTYVVVYLRSNSDLMGEPVSDRPGWRKALFRLKKTGDVYQIEDMDDIVKKFGEKPQIQLGEPLS